MKTTYRYGLLLAVILLPSCLMALENLKPIFADKDCTLVTIPDAGHWAHHDASELETDTMKCWLSMNP